MIEFLTNNKIVLWIAAAIIGCIALKYLYLIIKRISLMIRLRTKFGKSLRLTRNMLASVFVVNCKPDILLNVNGKTTAVAILSTHYTRTRYHFSQSGLLDIIVSRRGMAVGGGKGPGSTKYGAGSGGDVRIYIKRKYSLDFAWQDCNAEQKYIIVNPAPRELSKNNGSQIEALIDNDVLYNDIKICGAKYFFEKF